MRCGAPLNSAPLRHLVRRAEQRAVQWELTRLALALGLTPALALTLALALTRTLNPTPSPNPDPPNPSPSPNPGPRARWLVAQRRGRLKDRVTRDRLQRALRILTGAFGYCPDGPFQLIVAQVYKANVDERECTEVLARASSTVPSWTRESNAYQRVVRSAPDYPAFG